MHCCELLVADVTTEFGIERVRTIGVVVDWCGGAWEKKEGERVLCCDTLKNLCFF